VLPAVADDSLFQHVWQRCRLLFGLRLDLRCYARAPGEPAARSLSSSPLCTVSGSAGDRRRHYDGDYSASVPINAA
jgi:hypothetical protein